MKKHPYDKYIRAFLDGKVVQLRTYKGGVWQTVKDVDWFTIIPFEGCINEFRIMQQSVGYRRFLWQHRDGEIIVSTLRETEPDECNYWQKQSNFIEWIDTEWQYHTVTLDKPKKF